jgi:predicted ABC-type ATPase
LRRLVVYAGANGAGKSSLRAGGSDPVEVEIDSDRIAREINPVDPRAVDFAAGREALRRFDQAIAEGRSLSLETTLTGRTVLGRMQAAKDAGYDVTLRYIAVRDADVNVERVTARAAEGGHWIEPDVVRRRVAGSLENLPAAVAIADRAVLLDNTGATHRRVLEIERGRVLHQAPDAPPWLAGQLPRIAAELERGAQASRSSECERQHLTKPR